MACTVEEAKGRLSYPEACQWLEYRQKHGGIGHARTHHLLATLCAMFNNANGGKADLSDFLPGLPALPEPKPLEIDNIEQMMMLFPWSGPQ